MNIIKVLLNKEFIIFKKSLLFYSSLFFIFPLLLYLFFSIPLSLVFIDFKPIYIIWSSVGIWTISCLFITYLFHNLYLDNNYQYESIKSYPILSFHYLFSGYIYALIIAFLQLVISIIITSSFTNDYISILDFFKIALVIFPSIIIMCNVSFLVNGICSNNIAKNISNIIIFLTLSFGFGSFIPLSYYPDGYMNIIQYMPFSSSIYNVQNIISNEPIFFSLLLISIFYMLVFTVINYFLIENTTVNKN